MTEESVRVANDAVARALKSVAKAEAEVEEWNKLVKKNLNNPDFYISERDKANERLKEREAVLLQLSQSTHQTPDLPLFDSSTYRVSFPLLEAMNGEMYLTLLGRDDVVREINQITLYVPSNVTASTPKFSPIIISTSRGMGKTFLLKMLGMQKVEKTLKNVKIESAISCV